VLTYFDPTHYALLPRRPRRGPGSPERIDQAFLQRFPSLAPLCDGIKRRFKTLAPIHIRMLLRLVDRFGEPAFLAAASRAQEFRRFDPAAVRRILEREHPLADDIDPVPPLGGIGPAVLGEVEPGSIDSYGRLDTAAPEVPSASDTPSGEEGVVNAAEEGVTSPKPPADEEDDHGA
jgi:hypothetical protein